MTLFDEIRSACRRVAAQAHYVHIVADSVEPYAAALPLDQVFAPSLDPAHHYQGTPDKTLAYVLTVDAVNFGSGYFPHLRKRPGLSGYLTVASSLKDWFNARDAVRPEDLASLTPGDCTRIFGQDETAPAPVHELLRLFAEALNDLGRFTLEHYQGRFASLVEDARRSAEALVGILDRMPFYRDVHSYGHLRVPFYKRAQITAADLSVAFANQGWGRFDDLADLTIFADNLVPHVLRVDGLLRYEPDLLDRINREEPLTPGSTEEIEIRACGLTAVESLLDALRRRGVDVFARDLDYFLWNRGQRPEYKAHPRHRARCVYY